MADKIQELREKRQKITEDQRAILNKADTEKRALTSDEETTYNNMDVEFDSLTKEIDEMVKVAESDRAAELRKKKLEDREAELRRSQHQPNKPDLEDRKKNDDGDNIPPEKRIVEYNIDKRYEGLIKEFRKSGTVRSTMKFHEAYARYLLGGMNNLNSEDRMLLVSASIENRALQADIDSAGGYLVAPEQFVMQLIATLDNIVFVRKYANIISVPSAASLGAPARETDMGDVTWTSELGTGSADSSMKYDKRDLHPHPLARRIKVSRKLLRIALINIANEVSGRFAYKMGTVQENAFLNGSGINQPLGIFTASNLGISTGRDVSTGNTTSAMTADGLIEAKYTMPKQYRMQPSMRWVFHRSGVKQIRKLKDGEGQYLWKQGLSDKPDTILEIPFEESEYAPSTFTTGKYVGALGDWNSYWIADSLAMEIQVLTELYAETSEIGYICRSELDGMPVDENYWVRVKLA